MAAGDNRARQGGTVAVPGGTDKEIAHDVAKGDPVGKPRLAEDAERAAFYATAGQKDRLPEHVARRDEYPLITVDS